MNITCPRCGFSRELPADRLPSRAVIATCPHCACRFRFAPDTGAVNVLPDAAEQGTEEDNPRDVATGVTPGAAEEPRSGFQGDNAGDTTGDQDDPLPPGAIVPGRENRRQGTADAGDEPQTASRNRKPEPENENALKDAVRNLWGRLGGKDAAGDSPKGDSRGVSGRDDRQNDDPRAADRAADSALYRDGHADIDDHDANPWETAPEPDGWVSAFYHTCMRVMFGAHNFFAHIRTETSQVRPLLFYLIISVVQVVIERVWSGVFLSLMAPSAASDPELEKMLILLSPQLSLPMTVLLKTGVSVAQLYVLAALMHFTYGFISGRKTEFSLVFQVAAYAAAPALLCVVPLLGSIVGFIWMIACVLVGCRTALNLTWPQTLMGFAPVALLLAPLLLQIMKATQY